MLLALHILLSGPVVYPGPFHIPVHILTWSFQASSLPSMIASDRARNWPPSSHCNRNVLIYHLSNMLVVFHYSLRRLLYILILFFITLLKGSTDIYGFPAASTNIIFILETAVISTIEMCVVRSVTCQGGAFLNNIGFS